MLLLTLIILPTRLIFSQPETINLEYVAYPENLTEVKEYST